MGPYAKCQAAWNNNADGQTCGYRIAWLQKIGGLIDTDARNYVASEFPDECGACAMSGTSTTSPVASCQAAWNNNADGHTCGHRIAWLQKIGGLIDTDARNKVASEYPDECGACSMNRNAAANDHHSHKIFPDAPNSKSLNSQGVGQTGLVMSSCFERILQLLPLTVILAFRGQI